MTRDPIVITAPGPGLGEGVKQERAQRGVKLNVSSGRGTEAKGKI